jgi:hypothetical protein
MPAHISGERFASSGSSADELRRRGERDRLTATLVAHVERRDKVASLTVVLKLARGLPVAPSELLRSFSLRYFET